MKKLYYTITTLEPLIITLNSDDPNMYETLQYIRGTVIQGVFAQYYLKSKPADSEFTRLIVKGGCVFANAYPYYKKMMFRPSPFSIVKEKYQEEIVHNLLAYENADKIDEQTKGISSLVCIDSKEVHSLTIPKEIRLHNEIEDETRTSKQKILFNYQSLPTGMVFKGYLFIEEELDKGIIKSLFEQGTEIRIGRSATSEYGKVLFNWIDDQEEDTLQDGPVIMTLLSDTIIYNDYGFSSLNMADFNKYITGTTIAKNISNKSRIEGFLNVWKLRKPSENVFSAGSSFLLDKLPDNARVLINKGLGERSHEGYGQVSFNFQHSVVKDLIYAEPTRFVDNTVVPKIFPQLTASILQTTYLERAKSDIINHALKDADTNKTINPPKNHLLSRLRDMTEDIDSFTENIKKLKDIAKKQLEKSHIDNQTILNHLINRASHIDKICLLTRDINGFCVNLIPFKSELTQLYFEQYFNQLRRRNIKSEKL